MKENDAGDLLGRTKAFALRILRLAEALPKSLSGRTLAGQFARSGTSVAANYRAARRGRSKAEFIAKLSIAHEEADETCFWLELIQDAGMLTPGRLQGIRKEADEITAMLVASLKTAKANR